MWEKEERVNGWGGKDRVRQTGFYFTYFSEKQISVDALIDNDRTRNYGEYNPRSSIDRCVEIIPIKLTITPKILG